MLLRLRGSREPHHAVHGLVLLGLPFDHLTFLARRVRRGLPESIVCIAAS